MFETFTLSGTDLEKCTRSSKQDAALLSQMLYMRGMCLTGEPKNRAKLWIIT